MKKKVVVSLQKVTKVFRVKSADVNVINGVDLEIYKGEFVGLIGRSGSGKSTLMNLILGLEYPTSGDIELLGEKVKPENSFQLSELRRTKVGVFYQQPIWIKSLTVQENVAFPLILDGFRKSVATREAIEALATVGMLKWKNYYPQDLSVGQQQRIALARAIVNNPDIIFADEPTGNLDVANSKALVNMLHDLTKEDKTVIMITHNLDNLDNVDRIVHLLDGRVVQDVQVSDLTVEKLDSEYLAKMFFSDIKKFRKQHSNLKLPKLSKTSKKNKFNLASLKSFLNGVWNYTLSVFNLSFGILISYITFITSNISSLFRQKEISFTEEEERLNAKGRFSFLFHPGKVTKGVTYRQLLSISIKNMQKRRLRSLVTIGGISLGVAFTTFLLSLGFGVERLIIQNITSLNRITQIDVYPPTNNKLSLTLEDLESIKKLDEVSTYYPIISLASKVRYRGSDVDVVAHGVVDDYLLTSDFKLTSGNFLRNSPNGIVVNKSLLNVIDINRSLEIGDTIELAVKSLADFDTEIISDHEPYVLTGIIADGDTPIVYLPIENFQKLGITTFSEARVVVNSEEAVANTRTIIESHGFVTSSVLDTIDEIESIFTVVRLALVGVGIVGLVIASFGMFNTLTVSLLERTREVALMKAIGMLPQEVRALFLTEAVTMGILGGMLGLLLSFFGGFFVSFVYSLYTSPEGQFIFIKLTNLPMFFVLLVMLGSVLIGILTGIYPSRRAEKISSVYALRYE
jgi:ABC-type lipoprotein export system ATPase subunit/ABC-type lipoprotein release transport system permease subunit